MGYGRTSNEEAAGNVEPGTAADEAEEAADASAEAAEESADAAAEGNPPAPTPAPGE